MKKTILFLMGAILLMSCGGAGKLPTDYITLGTAFNHVAHSIGYWIPLLVVVVLGGYFLVYKSIVKYKEGTYDGMAITLRVFGFLVAFLLTLLIRPCEIAANTTVEQAERGAWIGY